MPPIKPIRKPKPAVPPFILSLPTDASRLPDDAQLRKDLIALGGTGSSAILGAYDAIGNRAIFGPRLESALIALPLPVDGGNPLRPFLVHIARLGAEAYVLDLRITEKVIMLGFIDHPDSLGSGLTMAQREQFLHFVTRRLLQVALSRLSLDERRAQMDKAIALFRLFHSELGREWRLMVNSTAVLIAYRQVMFQLVQTHYQALLEPLFLGQGTGGTYAEAVKELADHFAAITATAVDTEPPVAVPLYRVERNRFLDYFGPLRREFRFDFYSRHATPLKDHGPEVGMRAVVQKRREQAVLLDDLRPGRRPSTSAASSAPLTMPKPPGLYDNESWQQWTRRMWDATAHIVEPQDRLRKICELVGQHFSALTSHAPYDLADGSREANYLTRTYPRAITGALVHDCVVYAIRWIFVLGRLLAPRSKPPEIGTTQISIIEMPAHVGVMVRVRVSTTEDVLIAVNNQHAEVTKTEPTVPDEVAAEAVVEGMYDHLTTVIAIRKIKADPTKATALWNEIARLSDRKLRLPYDDSSEPWLRYLEFNARSTAIEQKMARQAGVLWRKTNHRLSGLSQIEKRMALPRELETYRVKLDVEFDDATKEFEDDLVPLAAEINSDVEDHRKDIPKNAVVIDGLQPRPPWEFAVKFYRHKLDEAAKLLKAAKPFDLTSLDPAVDFPETTHPTEVR